jgi:hypothetical protein
MSTESEWKPTAAQVERWAGIAQMTRWQGGDWPDVARAVAVEVAQELEAERAALRQLLERSWWFIQLGDMASVDVRITLMRDVNDALQARPTSAGEESDPRAALDNDLIDRFAVALKAKLAVARARGKGSWESLDWMDECRRQLVEHIAKGDPRDVANYCAFLWHHGESTTPAGEEGAR